VLVMRFLVTWSNSVLVLYLDMSNMKLVATNTQSTYYKLADGRWYLRGKTPAVSAVRDV
jgi:hypothetical protein